MMQIIEKEVFAFDLLNDIYDNHNLNGDDYGVIARQIQEASDHKSMDGLIRFLQGALLICMRGG